MVHKHLPLEIYNDFSNNKRNDIVEERREKDSEALKLEYTRGRFKNILREAIQKDILCPSFKTAMVETIESATL